MLDKHVSATPAEPTASPVSPVSDLAPLLPTAAWSRGRRPPTRPSVGLARGSARSTWSAWKGPGCSSWPISALETIFGKMQKSTTAESGLESVCPTCGNVLKHGQHEEDAL